MWSLQGWLTNKLQSCYQWRYQLGLIDIWNFIFKWNMPILKRTNSHKMSRVREKKKGLWNSKGKTYRNHSERTSWRTNDGPFPWLWNLTKGIPCCSCTLHTKRVPMSFRQQESCLLSVTVPSKGLRISFCLVFFHWLVIQDKPGN